MAQGWLDVSTRGRIRVTGEDRKRLIHAMTTNHVEGLAPGEWCYAFFLNSQGRILADCIVQCATDSLLLDLEPEVREKIYQHLDRFIIADDAVLEDVTESTAEILVAGEAPVGPAPTFVLHGVRHWVIPAAEKAAFVAALGDLPEWTPEQFRTWRLERGIPRYGEDITEARLVQETQQMEAVSFAKGCYLGQEIVERVRSRGSVNRLLVPLRIAGSTPERGAKVMAGEQEAGELTSAAYSSTQGAVRALAYLRAKFARAGTELQVGGAPAQVVEKG